MKPKKDIKEIREALERVSRQVTPTYDIDEWLDDIETLNYAINDLNSYRSEPTDYVPRPPADALFSLLSLAIYWCPNKSYYSLLHNLEEDARKELGIDILNAIKKTFTFRNALLQVCKDDAKVFPDRHKLIKEWLTND